MDAKEFLSQATVLNEKINMDFLHRERLREMLNRFGGGSNLQRERVQGGELPCSPVTKLVDQIADLDRLIEQEISEYEVVLAQIKDAIAFCGDYREMQILKGKYLESQTMSDICLILNIPESTAYNIHNRAIDKVESYLNTTACARNF